MEITDNPHFTPTGILKRLYHLCEHSFDQIACELALSYLEHELSDGRFGPVNELLTQADAEKLAPSVLLTILTITVHGKDQLAQRPRFLDLTAKKMACELGEDRAMKLLETRR